jgi:hypothetical protein
MTSPVSSRAVQPGSEADQLAVSYCGLSRQDLSRLRGGEVIVRTLDAADNEVALCSVADVAVPSGFYLASLRQIETFKRGAEVEEIGRVGTPAASRDFAALALPGDEAGRLAGCRPQHCAIQLDSDGMSRVRNAAGAAQALEILRAHLADYLQRYRAGGDAALMEYRDAAHPVSIASSLRQIVSRLPALARDAATASALIYWSRESIGPKSVVSITQMLIGHPGPRLTVVRSKQLYASHFFDASLGLTVLADIGTEADPRTRVVYINRSSVDAFTGLLGGLKRSITRSRARHGAGRAMRDLRRRLEATYVSRAR